MDGMSKLSFPLYFCTYNVIKKENKQQVVGEQQLLCT
jgi:hypothetical protein